MEFATGAMGSLLPKLGELLKEKSKLKGLSKDAKSLQRELRIMRAALRKVDQVPLDQLDENYRLWARRVRELSYDFEDAVDIFLLHGEGSKPAAKLDGLKAFINKMTHMFQKDKTHHLIRDMMLRAEEIAKQRNRYMAHVLARPASTCIDPHPWAMHTKPVELVGIQEARDELIRMLHGEEVSNQKLQTISILGFGGLGKTTLAKAVYDSLKVQFEYKAFVPLGHNPDMKKVFKDILVELEQNYKDLCGALLDERQLIRELRGLLQNKRYFIIIDDIWDIKSWELVKYALVDSNCGSRVIITTRIFEVAIKAGDVYKLKPLSPDSSKELLDTKLFGGNGICPGDQPPEITERILQKCGGVPLAIITIASLLVDRPRESWFEVYNSIGFGCGNNSNVKDLQKTMAFSYYNLPSYLRSCLLYLIIFPYGSIIKKDVLIWKWVAEGFVHEELGKGFYELGEQYFNELINRSLIQPVEIQQTGKIIGCRVHNLVLDLIYALSREENFITVLDNNEQHTFLGKPRRLAIFDQHEPLVKVITYTQQLRSFNATMCHFNTMPHLLNFQVLRVLSIEDCTFVEGRLYPLGKLTQLRYLGLRRTPVCKLPEEIGDLRFMQTLDLRQTKIEELPHSVSLLRQLKCLRADCNSFRVSDWIVNLTSLEELLLNNVDEFSNFVKDLGKMTELRELRIKRFSGSLNKLLVDSLLNLQKIRVLVLGDSLPSKEPSLESYVPPRQLRHLTIKVKMSTLPAWISSSFLPNLSHLYLALIKSVDAHDVETLGRLPELLSLSMFIPSNIFPTVMGGGAFQKLRYCNMSAPLRLLKGAMPSLESVQFIVQVQALKEANFDFDFGSLENLPRLQNVIVDICYTGDPVDEVKEAEASLRHVVDIHPNHPVLALTKSDKWEDQKVYFNHCEDDDNEHRDVTHQQEQEGGLGVL